MKKRLLAWAIAITMLFGQVPAYAAEMTAEIMEAETSAVQVETEAETDAKETESVAEETEETTAEETTVSETALAETAESSEEEIIVLTPALAAAAAAVPENLHWVGHILSWDDNAAVNTYRYRIHYAGKLWDGSENVCRQDKVSGHCTNLSLVMMEMAMENLSRTGSRTVELNVEVAAGETDGSWVAAPVCTYTLDGDIQQLSAPSGLSWNGTVLAWNTVKDATEYELRIDNGYSNCVMKLQERYIDLKDTLNSMGGEFFRDARNNVMPVTASVRALDGDYRYADSNIASAPVLKYTLAGYKVLDKVTDIRWDGYILRWNTVSGAESYVLEVTFGEGEKAFSQKLETKDTCINLTDTLRQMCDSYGCVNEPSKTSVSVRISGQGTNCVSAAVAESPKLAINGPVTLSTNKITAEDHILDSYSKARKIDLGVKAEGDAPLTYKTSNSKVSVSKSGVITIPAKFVGTAVITVTAAATAQYSKSEKQIRIVVNPLLTVKDLNVTASSSAKTYSLGTGLVGKATLSYSSDNSKVTIEPKGKIKVAPFCSGSANITVTAAGANGTSAKKTIHVNIAPLVDNKISLEKSAFTRQFSSKAQSFYLEASAGGSAKLSYKSDTKKVKVSKSGKVTIAKNYLGKATITITSAETSEYYSASRSVTVEVVPGSNTIKVKAGADGIVKKSASKAQTFSLGASAGGKAPLSYSIKSASASGLTISKGKVTIPANYAGQAVIHIHADAVLGYYATDLDVTLDVKPATPGLKVTNSAAGTIEASWNTVAAADGYVIQLGDNKDDIEFGGSYIQKTIDNPKAVSDKITSVHIEKGKVCYVRIKAVTKSGTSTISSDWSKVQSVQITK